MALRGLDHVNVKCSDLARSRAFYADALGLRDGERPFPERPGAWMYLGDQPIVHLGSGGEAGGVAAGSGFDHIAFNAEDLPGVRERLQRLDVEFREREIASMNLTQIFLFDPDGVKIEINFRR
jgi:catechol 2,3-dioxygenase-like lactoylglutathione lyase family enzyme